MKMERRDQWADVYISLRTRGRVQTRRDREEKVILPLSRHFSTHPDAAHVFSTFWMEGAVQCRRSMFLPILVLELWHRFRVERIRR
jgi:hypothetical protein